MFSVLLVYEQVKFVREKYLMGAVRLADKVGSRYVITVSQFQPAYDFRAQYDRDRILIAVRQTAPKLVPISQQCRQLYLPRCSITEI